MAELTNAIRALQLQAQDHQRTFNAINASLAEVNTRLDHANALNERITQRLTAVEGTVHTDEEFEGVPRRVEPPRHQPARRLE